MVCVGRGGASSSTWRCNGVSMVYVVCVCVCVCVFEAKVFCTKHYHQFDLRQFATVCCKVKLMKQCMIVGYFVKNRSLDDRSGGWVDGMDWFSEG